MAVATWIISFSITPTKIRSISSSNSQEIPSQPFILVRLIPPMRHCLDPPISSSINGKLSQPFIPMLQIPQVKDWLASPFTVPTLNVLPMIAKGVVSRIISSFMFLLGMEVVLLPSSRLVWEAMAALALPRFLALPKDLEDMTLQIQQTWDLPSTTTALVD